jgi:hypothetical protein
VRIQPAKSLEAIDELLAKTTNPDHRQMLENFKAHLTAEIACDIEGIMATMSPHPRYHPNYPAPDLWHVDGREQNRAMYQKIFDEGSSVIQLEGARLAVADWGIAGDGVQHTIIPGKVMVERGATVDDEDAYYLSSIRIAFFLPYENGLMTGEDSYRAVGNSTIVKLDPSEVVTVEEAFA